jgi:selenide,water dikinase
VKAATDITGFGLIGHALGIARESDLTLEIDAAAVPLLPEARTLSRRFRPGGLKANREQFEPKVRFGEQVEDDLRTLFFDPQTSGGLFLLVPEEAAPALLADLPLARAIGRAVPRGSHAIQIS